jgi:hypothetical protein
MKNAENFIRFDGRLWENMTFKHRSGWETKTIAKRPQEGDGSYQLELLDAAGKVLVSVSPDVDFQNICREKTGELLSTRVVAYIPTHPNAEEMIFQRGDLIIFREKISKLPPKIELKSIEVLKDNKIQISWSAKHPEEKTLTFNVIYITDDGRTFNLARNLTSNKYVVDLNQLVGCVHGKISILATDGIRSGFAVSDNIEVPFKPPVIFVRSPKDGDILPPDQPVSLNGFASDVGGMRLPDRGLVWYVNGNKVSEGQWQFIVEGLEPGKHRVEVHYVMNGKVVADKKISFRIKKRDKKQLQYLEIVNAMKIQRETIGTWPTPEKPEQEK